jgi:hypothetical protein
MTNSRKVTRINPEMTVLQAAEHGSQRDLLVALRRRLAESLEDERTQPRDLSPLTMRLREIAQEIEALDIRDGDESESFEPISEIFDPDSI